MKNFSKLINDHNYLFENQSFSDREAFARAVSVTKRGLIAKRASQLAKWGSANTSED